MTAVGTTSPMRLMLGHHGRRQRHFRHLMPGRFGIIVLRGLGQRPVASLAGRRPVMHNLVDPLGRKASPSMTRMPRLSARHAPGRRFAGTLERLRWIARRWPRRVRRVLLELRFQFPNPLLQLGDSGLKRRPHLPDEFLLLPTPRTLRLRRHPSFIGLPTLRPTRTKWGSERLPCFFLACASR